MLQGQISTLHLSKAGSKQQMAVVMEISHVTVMASTINLSSHLQAVSETLVLGLVRLPLGIDEEMLPHLAVAIAPCMVNTVEVHVIAIVAALDARIEAEETPIASEVPIVNVGAQVLTALVMAMSYPLLVLSTLSMIRAFAKE